MGNYLVTSLQISNFLIGWRWDILNGTDSGLIEINVT